MLNSRFWESLYWILLVKIHIFCGQILQFFIFKSLPKIWKKDLKITFIISNYTLYKMKEIHPEMSKIQGFSPILAKSKFVNFWNRLISKVTFSKNSFWNKQNK